MVDLLDETEMPSASGPSQVHDRPPSCSVINGTACRQVPVTQISITSSYRNQTGSNCALCAFATSSLAGTLALRILRTHFSHAHARRRTGPELRRVHGLHLLRRLLPAQKYEVRGKRRARLSCGQPEGRGRRLDCGREYVVGRCARNFETSASTLLFARSHL